MLGVLHSQDVLKSFDSVKGQIVLERDLQQFFKSTTPAKIENTFRDIGGSASSQFLYLNLVLKVIEELDIEPVQAFALLEAIRPIIYRKFEAVTDRFVGKAVLPGSKNTTIVFEALEVFARLTDTYDSVIVEARHFGDSQTFIMGSAIHRALSDKARLVLCYQQLYQDVPASVWRHVNFLYRTADEFNIFNHVMPDKLAFRQHALTVRQLYLYIMLMSCAGTANMTVEEISALAELLKDWIKQVGIKKLPADAGPQALCMDPAILSTPVFLGQLANKTSVSLFCIDLGKLPEKLLRSRSHQKFVDNIRYVLSPWTTERIVSNWTQFAERTSLRCSDVAPRYLTAYVGLSAPVAAPMACSTVSTRDLRDKKLSLTMESDQVPLDVLTTLPADQEQSLQARIIDHSAAGYRLQWLDDGGARLAINEVLVLQDDRDGVCRLGQIIWIRAVSRSEYQTGVAILSAEVMPVQARLVPLPYSNSSDKIARGFVICQTMGDQRHFGILLAQAAWQTNQAVELIQTDKSFHARLLEPLKQNEKYQAFNIAFFKD